MIPIKERFVILNKSEMEISPDDLNYISTFVFTNAPVEKLLIDGDGETWKELWWENIDPKLNVPKQTILFARRTGYLSWKMWFNNQIIVEIPKDAEPLTPEKYHQLKNGGA